MTIAQAAGKMVEILGDKTLSVWDVENKIGILIEKFEGVVK